VVVEKEVVEVALKEDEESGDMMMVKVAAEKEKVVVKVAAEKEKVVVVVR
jgi:hypothetical protein